MQIHWEKGKFTANYVAGMMIYGHVVTLPSMNKVVIISS